MKIGTVSIGCVLVFLVILVCADTTHWMINNHCLGGQDTDDHVCFAQDMYYRMSDVVHDRNLSWYKKIPTLAGLLKTTMPLCPTRNPNAVYMVTGATCLVFGKSLFVMKMSNYFFLIILLAFVYLLGKELLSSMVGLTACCFLMLFPIIYQGSRQYGLDLPLAAAVTMAMYFLIKSDHFSRWTYSLAFSFACVAGILIKPVFALFLVGPVLAVTSKALIEYVLGGEKCLFARRVLAVSVSLLLAVAVSAFLWWGDKADILLKDMRVYSLEITALFPNVGQLILKRLFGLLEYTALNAVGYPIIAGFLVSGVAFAISTYKYKYVYIAWFVIPYLYFSYIVIMHHPRYIFPAFACMALILAWAVHRVRSMWIRYSLLAIFVAILSVQYYFSPRSIHPSGRDGWLSVHSDYYDGNNSMYAYHKVNELMASVGDILSDEGTRTVVMVSLIPKYCRFKPFEIRYYFRERYKECNYLDFAHMYYKVPMKSDLVDIIVFAIGGKMSGRVWQDTAQIDTLLLKDKDKIPYFYFIHSAEYKSLLAMLADAKKKFILRSIIPVPDCGYSWVVYVKKKSIEF